MWMLALGAAIGALITYFLDPQSGRRRRAVTRERAAATVRTGADRAADTGRTVASEASGVSQKVQQAREEPKDYDDVTLAQKVQSEIFRDSDVPKGQIAVNVQEGVVALRGEVPSTGMIDELIDRARNVQGVREVENLLHVPGSEAPMHQ
jgi:osmotically-inducible protein OsmY